MLYREQNENSKKYKQNYLDGIEKLIAERQKDAEAARAKYTKDILSDGERFRADLRKMLGWPLVDYTPEGLPKVTSEKLADEGKFEIFRMQFEILDGLFMTGLLFKLRGDEKKQGSEGAQEGAGSQNSKKRPLVIVQHGGGGSPELVAGFYGTTSNYHKMLGDVLERDCHAFLPQLYVWGEGYGVGYDRNAVDARLKRLGSSITALEVFGITRILDYFESQPYVKNFGMVGLSYGGFYTLFTAAADTRIRSALTCAQFNTRDAYPWPDWVWRDSGFLFDDAEIACLVYPRRLCIAVGDKDDLFNYRCAVGSFERVKEICRDVGTDWVDFTVFDGIHEYLHDEGPIERLLADLK